MPKWLICVVFKGNHYNYFGEAGSPIELVQQLFAAGTQCALVWVHEMTEFEYELYIELQPQAELYVEGTVPRFNEDIDLDELEDPERERDNDDDDNDR